MKRRLLIALFAAVFFVGIIMVLNRTPNVEIGDVIFNCENKQTTVDGYDIQRYVKGKTTAYNEDLDVVSLYGKMPAFEQKVVKNDGTDAITMNTTMAVGFTGRFVDDVVYTIYDFKGNILESDASTLNLPTKDIEGCIVKVDVKWGRTENYLERYYFMRIDYIKE